jgi:all-trans-8'-apo-beta-carotenal 15,15'-oxygenase
MRRQAALAEPDETLGGDTAHPWAGLFDPAPEIGPIEVEVEGRIPEAVRGRLWRIGPAGTRTASHWYDGDGLVSVTDIAPGKPLHHRSRYVQTRKHERDRAGKDTRTFGTQRPGGILANAMRRPASIANAYILPWNGRLLAHNEAGHPWALAPDSLETIGMYDFDGSLPRREGLSAHPSVDPVTGDLFTFGMFLGAGRNYINAYRARPGTRLRRLGKIRLPAAYINHDFGVTARFMVFCLGPNICESPYKAFFGLKSYADSWTWHPELPTVVALVPVDGGRLVRFEADPWFQYHVVGAFDDDDKVVIDVCRYDDIEPFQRQLTSFRTTPFQYNTPTLWRYRIDPTRRTCVGEQLCSYHLEDPVNDALPGSRCYRNVFGTMHASPDGDGMFDSIGRIDTLTGEVDIWYAGRGYVPTEPTYVATGKGALGGGWLVSFVFNPDRAATDLVVLPAQRPSDGPVAIARLPVSTGFMLHGEWEAR